MSDSVVKSVGRVFEVFELFDAERAALTATAIARTLRYPASSTVALLKSMVHLGYLTYDHAERTYFPSLRVPLISYWLEYSFFVDGHLLELLEDVTNATDESTCLSWQSDLDMQFVRYRVGTGGIPAPFVGSRMPLFATAAGLTALTQKRDVDIIKLLERSSLLTRKTNATMDVPATMALIRRFRAQGYGVEYENPLTPSHATLSWALRRRSTSRCAVLSVTGASERIKSNEKTIVAAVKTALQRHGA